MFTHHSHAKVRMFAEIKAERCDSLQNFLVSPFQLSLAFFISLTSVKVNTLVFNLLFDVLHEVSIQPPIRTTFRAEHILQYQRFQPEGDLSKYAPARVT